MPLRASLPIGRAQILPEQSSGPRIPRSPRSRAFAPNKERLENEERAARRMIALCLPIAGGDPMPGFLLHEGAIVTCAHGGQAQPTVSIPSVTLSGQPIVTVSAPYVVAGCAFPPPPAANGPDTTAMFVTSSLNITVFGQPVVLDDSLSICALSGTPLIISETQVFVSGL
jgi:hypothetical protein